MSQRSMDKVLSFPAKEKTHLTGQEAAQKQPVPLGVRRRRLLWFGCMVAFLLWFLVSMIFQQFRIWNHQEKLAAKQHQIQLAKAERIELQQTLKKLQQEDYLLELAHKLGYSYPGEENYEVKENTEDTRQHP